MRQSCKAQRYKTPKLIFLASETQTCSSLENIYFQHSLQDTRYHSWKKRKKWHRQKAYAKKKHGGKHSNFLLEITFIICIKVEESPSIQ